MRATEKQVRYIMWLLNRAGYPTDWMSSRHKALGATMRERSGRVLDWVQSLDRFRASKVIHALIAELAARGAHVGKEEK